MATSPRSTGAATRSRRSSGEAGATVERLPQADAGAHLRATLGDGARQVLLLGHFDTVWPIGTLAQMPVDDQRTAACTAPAPST